MEHARREGYAPAPPGGELETDADLDKGDFGIATRIVQWRRPPQDAPRAGRGRGTRWSTSAGAGAAGGRPRPRSCARSPRSRWTARSTQIEQRRWLIGRSKECDVQLADPNVVAPPRGAPPGGRHLLARRPRLDERASRSTGRRVKRFKLEDGDARHGRLDRDRLPAGGRLILGRLGLRSSRARCWPSRSAFLVLLYLFIWRIVRSASRDMRLPQESMILRPRPGRAAAPAAGRGSGALVVVSSPALTPGGSASRSTRSSSSAAALERRLDSRATSTRPPQHARIEPRRDGIYVADDGSTNGTYVNGIRLSREPRLSPGDVVRDGRDRAALRAVTTEAPGSDRRATARPTSAASDATTRTPTYAPAALRGRGRHGRRAGRRARVAARGRGAARARTAGGGEARSWSSSGRRTAGCTSVRSMTPAASGMGTTMTVALFGRQGHGHDRPRRRLARVPPPRRPARAADRRPLARRGARPPREALGRGGGGAPAALRDHARARHRSRRRRRHVHRCSAVPGDVFLLCSDGLTTMVGDGRSPRSCSTVPTSGAARELVAAANGAGGEDNITAVLFEVAVADVGDTVEETAIAGYPDEAVTPRRRTLPLDEAAPASEATRAEGPPSSSPRQVSDAQAAVGAAASTPAQRRRRGSRTTATRRRRSGAVARVLVGRSPSHSYCWASLAARGGPPMTDAIASSSTSSSSALLTGLGFASVYIARQAEISRARLLCRPLRRPLPRGALVARSRCRMPTRTCCRWRLS